MNAYPEWSLLFDEDRLPPGQQPIVTAGIRQFRTASNGPKSNTDSARRMLGFTPRE